MTNFTRHLGALAAGVAAVGAASPAPRSPIRPSSMTCGGKFDKSFNEAAYNGAEALEGRNRRQLTSISNCTDDAQREQALRRFAAQGCNPIVMAELLLAPPPLGTVAAEFPDTNFVVIDAVVDLPNVQSVMFDEHDRLVPRRRASPR
ncbi:MAG: BMP family ABC transporter substrate-binding protein [Candidatus Promineifilaceae bacterium]